MSDGERLLDLVGVALAVALVAGLAMVIALGISGGPDGTEDAPVANWNPERINDTHVRIIHAGGDPVDTDGLVVTVGGNRRTVTWSKTLFEGDAGVVRARTGETVELYWQPSPETDRKLLRRWEP